LSLTSPDCSVDAKNAGEVGATVLVLRWEWQVPLPASADEVAARTTKPGGPELPVPPVCKICKHVGGDNPYTCETSKSGKLECEVRPDDSATSLRDFETRFSRGSVFTHDEPAVAF
jgi:hypothetical protein